MLCNGTTSRAGKIGHIVQPKPYDFHSQCNKCHNLVKFNFNKCDICEQEGCLTNIYNYYFLSKKKEKKYEGIFYEYLTFIISSIFNILNPEKIVFAGKYKEDININILNRKLKKYLFQKHIPTGFFVRSTLKNDITALGSAIYVYLNTINDRSITQI
jgi:predicted NBD/HSP70 family sugar kinase